MGEADGYARAARIGNTIHISGMTAVACFGNVVGLGSFFDVLRPPRRDCGAALHDVVPTSMFVVDVEQWEALGEAHREEFGDIPPAARMIEIA